MVENNDFNKAKLYVINRNCSIEEYNLHNQTVIGRNVIPGQIDIGLHSPIVSRIHGQFVLVDDKPVYQDLNSSNGTIINNTFYGKKTSIFEKKLEDGDVFKIDIEANDINQSKSVVMIYRENFDVTLTWQYIELTEDCMEIQIGKEETGNSVALNDERLQNHHATFFKGEEGWAITVHNGAEGVYINNKKIENALYLKNLDVIRIFDNMFVFMDNKLIYSTGAVRSTDSGRYRKTSANSEIEMKNLGDSLYINIERRTVRHGLKNLTLLKDINITINPGEMVLILGGSGAGKTTFMNAVMGYEKATGSIKHGNVDIYSQYEKMKYLIGFVPQDVLVRENDTVYETLINAAKMKMPQGTTGQQRKDRVEQVLEMVNLKHVKNSLVRSISGGEKKRVSAGVELVSDPSLFFLDEPDSGLDAQSAIELMENLRTIADTGKIVMIISHSPDRVQHLFDKIIVLAKDKEENCGRLAFFGSVDEAKKFFETQSLEGVVGKINGKDNAAKKYIDKWNSLKMK